MHSSLSLHRTWKQAPQPTAPLYSSGLAAASRPPLKDAAKEPYPARPGVEGERGGLVIGGLGPAHAAIAAVSRRRGGGEDKEQEDEGQARRVSVDVHEALPPLHEKIAHRAHRGVRGRRCRRWLSRRRRGKRGVSGVVLHRQIVAGSSGHGRRRLQRHGQQ
uniref:Uncharacterized protein n=1 Tax=Zea mays TaxID=4577 RepID=C4J0G3_MAIZE|nr:unknown [Zea mays]